MLLVQQQFAEAAIPVFLETIGDLRLEYEYENEYEYDFSNREGILKVIT